MKRGNGLTPRVAKNRGGCTISPEFPNHDLSSDSRVSIYPCETVIQSLGAPKGEEGGGDLRLLPRSLGVEPCDAGATVVQLRGTPD